MDGVDRVNLDGDRDLPEGTWTVNELTREIESVLNDAHSRFPKTMECVIEGL